MFLNKTQFKKMIKGAFNHGGLTVGRIYGGIVLCGGNWITWTEDGYVPNWLKATIIEYTGELPEMEHVFKAKKDDLIQYEIEDNDLFDLPQMYRNCKYAFTITAVAVDAYSNTYRIMQEKQTGELFAISAGLYDVIDYSELGDENRPGDPASTTQSGSILLWKNEHSAYACCRCNEIGDQGGVILDCLREINFDKGEK